MGKLSKRTKKILSIFLAILLIITGTSIVSVLADNPDSSDFAALGASEAELGESDSRITMVATPTGDRPEIYSGFDMELETTAPAGKVEITLPVGMDYSEESNEEAAAAGLVAYNADNRLLTLNFQESTLGLGESTELGESSGDSEGFEKIKIALLPMEVKEFTFEAEHNEGDKAELKVDVKSIIAPMSGTRTSFAKFGGIDLKDGDFSRVVPITELNDASKVLGIGANFHNVGETPADYEKRTVTVEIGKGLRIEKAPGLKASGDGNLWVFDNTVESLGSLKDIIVGATFTRDSEKVYDAYQGLGGTIVYEIANGTQSVDIDVMIKSDLAFWVGGKIKVNSAASGATNSTVPVEIPNAIKVVTNRVKRSAPGVTEEMDNATLDTLKVEPNTIYIIGTRARPVKAEPGETVTMDISSYHSTSSRTPTGLFKEATLVYNIPAGLTVNSVSSWDGGIPAANLKMDTTTTPGVLYITAKEFYGLLNIRINLTVGLAAAVGTELAFNERVTLVPNVTTESFSPIQGYYSNATPSYMNYLERQVVSVMGPFEDKLTLFGRTMNINKVDTNDDLRLGGFLAKNEQRQALTNHRIRMTFDDPNIKVSAVTISAGGNSFKDVILKTRLGETVAVGNLTGAATRNVVLSDVFPGVTDGDSIASIEYYTDVPLNTYWGSDNAYETPYAHLAYYGKIDSSLAVGDTYTAKIETTTFADTDFTATTKQQATVTMKIVDTGKSMGINGATVLSGEQKPGGEITLTTTFKALGSRNINNLNLQKGWRFLIKEIPYSKFVEGSFVLSDPGTGKSYPVTGYIYDDGFAADGSRVYQIDVPDALLSVHNTVRRNDLQLAYKVVMSKTSPSQSLKLSDYLFVIPMDNLQLDLNVQGGVSAIVTTTPLFEGIVPGAKQGLTHVGDANITLSSDVNFTLATAARLDAGGNTGPWVTYDEVAKTGQIILDPAGEAFYRLYMENLSEKEINQFVAYIPIPKYNEYFDQALTPINPDDYNHANHVQQAKFGWDTYITSVPIITGTFRDYKIEYATEYIHNGNDTVPAKWSSNFAAIPNKKAIRTVKITSNSVIPAVDVDSNIVFAMDLDDNAEDPTRAGAINTYSAVVYRDMPGSTGTLHSEPISIKLKTGVISGTVFRDANNNGIFDAGETGEYNVSVKAYEAGKAGDDSFLIPGSEVRTLTNGTYRINGLDKGQNVDIVFTNPDASVLKFTAPATADNHVTAVAANIAPSVAGQAINAGLVTSNTLNFSLNYTGSPTPPDSLVKFPGELVTELPKEVDYPRANYSLDGWFTKATGGTEVVVTGATTIDQILAKIVADGGTNTLYAQWTRQQADVTVERYKYTNAVGDATPIDSNVIVDQNVGGTYTATAANDVVGHTYNAGVSTPSITVDINPASNKVKLYYQANLYNVITDPDNGTPATTTSTRFGTIIPEPQAPSKTGHTPTGSWVDVGNGNAIWNFTTGTVPVGGVSLKATWTVNSYAISFDVNGGTTLAVAPPTSLNYDAVIPNPGVTSRPGYDFKGWFTQTAPGVWGAQYTPGTSKMPDSALALFAKWENNATRATISFNLDGGTYDGAATIADQSLKGGEKVAKPDNAKLAKPGMKPLGWYTAASGGSLWDFDAPLEHALFKNQTLHMVWAPDGAALMTVTYDLDGGLYNGLPANPATTQTWVGQTVSKPNLPLTKDGYLFDAWYIKNSDNSVGAEWNFATVISSGTFGNLNLIAKWTPQPYALTFDENTGTALAPAIKNQSIIFGTKPTQPAAGATNHPGYLLEGWYTVDAGGALVTKWDFVTGTMPSKAIILKANWTVVAAQTVTYTFNPQGGTYTGPAGDLSQVKNAGTTLTKPDETKLTLPGMKFEGWFPNSNGTGAIWNFADKLEHGKFENTTLYAKWSIDPTKKMTVSFDLAGGKYNNTTAITAQQLIIGEKVITPGDSLMSKEGNTFNSWKIKNPNGTAGAPWNFNTEITSANFGNMTLIATWDVNPYNITFNVNGGSALTGAVPTTVNFGTVIPAISVTARPGYIFEGWFDALSPTAQYTPGTSTMPAKNIDLVAKWRVDTSNTVAITFDLKGGKYNGQATIQTQNKTAGSTVDEPTVANLSKPGYSFTKWIVKGTSNEWIFTTVLENADFKNTALEAVWDTDATQTVSADFNLNGGKMGASTTIPSQTLRVLEKITEPAPASLNKEGHTFDAWYLEGSDGKPTTTKWNFNTQITHENWGNKKLIAVWKANPYVVTFDSANGSANKDVSVIFGTKVTEPAKPSKLGHTFGGWYKADNTAWNFNTPMPAANFTLTADWTINNYQVTIDPNNGTTPTNQSIQFGQKVTKPADPSKTGYDFGGWHLANSDGTLGSAWDFATNTVPAKDITIKAQWNIKTYTITVNHNVYATDKTTATLEKTETFTKEHFSTFTAKPIDIPYYTFIQAESDELSFSVDGAKTVSLYYKTDSYTLSVVEELELDVNDRFPEAKNNKLSWEQVVELLEAQTVNSNDPATFAARAAKSVEFSTITSSDYDAVDYSAITDGYTQSFNVTATWGNGNTDSKAVRVKISDRVAPEITNLSDNRRFYFELGKGIATEALFRNFLDNEGVAVVDNYDGELPMVLSYANGGDFSSIKWGTVGEYGLFLSSEDSSKNPSKKAIVISVWGSSPGDGGDGDGKGPGKGPDVDTSLPGDGDGSNGSGNNGNDGSGNNTNNGSGNYLDDKGNLVDSKGNKLGSVYSRSVV